jgi:death-on-curing protein
VKYLTPEQVLFIHNRLIRETGGSLGLRDLGLLQSALARPQATFGGKELYKDIFSKTAALLTSLINNHPFVDGNKRVGITSAALFLELNGVQLKATNNELVVFTLSVATSKLELTQVASWFREHV